MDTYRTDRAELCSWLHYNRMVIERITVDEAGRVEFFWKEPSRCTEMEDSFNKERPLVDLHRFLESYRHIWSLIRRYRARRLQ